MKKTALKIVALISALVGLYLLISTIYPIASYEAMSRSKFPKLLSPIPQDDEAVTLKDFDYTKASNWFLTDKDSPEFNTSKVSYYTLSIPKLGIKDATVAIGGEDLSDHLIQYPGTALPGQIGNSVIFGHSILPSFYNPKSYLAIFSTLPTLKRGDEMEIFYDSVRFIYRVEDMFEVLPTDIQVLEQDSADSYLTLVTCTPPGDPRKPKRLIVRARIVPLEQANADFRN